jgi:hypothetical protein
MKRHNLAIDSMFCATDAGRRREEGVQGLRHLTRPPGNRIMFGRSALPLQPVHRTARWVGFAQKRGDRMTSLAVPLFFSRFDGLGAK